MTLIKQKVILRLWKSSGWALQKETLFLEMQSDRDVKTQSWSPPSEKKSHAISSSKVLCSVITFHNSVISQCTSHWKLYFFFLLKGNCEVLCGVRHGSLHILWVAVFLLWVNGCLCFNHDQCTNTKGLRDILLLKHGVFPAANLGQVYSKQIFFFFLAYEVWAAVKTPGHESKRTSVEICLVWGCNP